MNDYDKVPLTHKVKQQNYSRFRITKTNYIFNSEVLVVSLTKDTFLHNKESKI